VTSISGRKLNGIWPGLCQERDYTRHIFDAREETDLVEEAMINSDIEAVTIRPEEAIKTVSDGHLILLLGAAAISTSNLWKSKCSIKAEMMSMIAEGQHQPLRELRDEDSPKLSKPALGLPFLEFDIWLSCARLGRLGFILKSKVLLMRYYFILQSNAG
jgi:hypothetical protein